MKNGLGTYTFRDGRCYAGDYEKDMRHGSGVLTFKDKSKLKGMWKLGRAVFFGFIIRMGNTNILTVRGQ